MTDLEQLTKNAAVASALNALPGHGLAPRSQPLPAPVDRPNAPRVEVAHDDTCPWYHANGGRPFQALRVTEALI